VRLPTQYAATWRRFWSGLIVLSLALAPVVADPAVMVSVAASGAILAGIVGVALTVHEGQPLRRTLSVLGRSSAWGAAASVALVVVGTTSGSLVLWLLVAAAVSSPPLVEAVCGTGDRLRMEQQPTPPVSYESTTRDLLLRLSSLELCRMWRSTHRYLQAARTPLELVACARLREMLLDELDSRHPDAVAAWLAAGACAADGPERFLPPSDRRHGST
jgi:hypothetical protein